MHLQKPTPADDLRQAVLGASVRTDVVRFVTGIYTQLAADIAQRRPMCVASGRCCHFERHGHRLYVTTMELAAFVHELNQWPPDRALTEQAVASWSGEGCPFQLQRLCGVHGLRPFGCRIYFCDPTSSLWQQERYEHYHAQLRAAHHDLGVAYYYTEWRRGLESLDLAVPVTAMRGVRSEPIRKL
jgi:hypothetical protein